MSSGLAVLLTRNSSGIVRICNNSKPIITTLHYEQNLNNFLKRLFATVAAPSAEKEAYNRQIRHCNVCTVGYQGHGKTTLASAITKILHEKNLSEFKRIEDIDNLASEQKEKMSIHASKLDYFTEKRHYALWDCPGHFKHMKNAIPPAMQSNGVIFVASATDEELSDTRDAILFIKNIGIKNIVVYVNKVDKTESKLDDRVEKLRELIKGSGFSKDFPIITGSALAALKETDDAIGKDSIVKLLDAVDQHIPVSDQTSNKPFIIPIDKTYLLKGLGTIVSGNVEQGTIKKGVDAQLLGYGKQIPTKINGLEMFGKVLEESAEGDHVFALVERVDRSDVKSGMVLCQPGACTLHDHCEAEIHVLTEDDGGKDSPLIHLTQQTMFCKTWDTPTTILTPEKDINPGETSTTVLHLKQPMVMNVGSEFVLVSNNKLIGTGKIKKLLPNLTDQDKANVTKEKKQKKKEKKAKETPPDFNPRLA